MSADGTKLVAAVGFSVQSGLGRIYISTNSGWSWKQSLESSNHWVSVASSADGTRLVAANPGGPSGPAPPIGGIYASSDSGESWSLTGASNEVWTSVASSADGTRLVAAFESYVPTGTSYGWIPWGGGIYISTDVGATWVDSGAPDGLWAALACSADGYRVVAGDQSVPPLLCALPYAGPWRITNAPGFEAVAASADGTKLVAAGTGGIYSSSDSGTTWRLTSASLAGGKSVASSADGTKLVAVVGTVWLSDDSGATWQQASAPADVFWILRRHFRRWNQVGGGMRV